MAIDTKSFDDAITAKQAEIDLAQEAVDADNFIAEQKAAAALAASLSAKQNEKATIEQNKIKAIALEAEIAADEANLAKKQAELAELLPKV